MKPFSVLIAMKKGKNYCLFSSWFFLLSIRFLLTPHLFLFFIQTVFRQFFSLILLPHLAFNTFQTVFITFLFSLSLSILLFSWSWELYHTIFSLYSQFPGVSGITCPFSVIVRERVVRWGNERERESWIGRMIASSYEHVRVCFLGTNQKYHWLWK